MLGTKKGSAYAKLERQEKQLDMKEERLEKQKKAAKAVEMEAMIRGIVRSELAKAGKRGK